MTLVDFQVYGRSDPTEINRQTRVVKQGKKVRVYNYREIPLEDEDLKFSLNKAVAETYKAIRPYNYTRIVREGLFDKRVYRYMKAGNIMVDGSKYTGQFLRDTSIKDGIGQIIYTDGSLFEGVFKKNDTLKGRYITTNGYVYEGSMKNHKMHGYGILKYKGETIHEGEFEDGEQVGDKFEVMSSLNSTITATDSAIGKVASKKSVQFNLK